MGTLGLRVVVDGKEVLLPLAVLVAEIGARVVDTRAPSAARGEGMLVLFGPSPVRLCPRWLLVAWWARLLRLAALHLRPLLRRPVPAPSGPPYQ